MHEASDQRAEKLIAKSIDNEGETQRARWSLPLFHSLAKRAQDIEGYGDEVKLGAGGLFTKDPEWAVSLKAKSAKHQEELALAMVDRQLAGRR